MAEKRTMPSSTDLTDDLKRLAAGEGAELFGVADLSAARDFLLKQGGQIPASFPRAVSVGMKICDAVVETNQPEEPRELSFYSHHIYEVMTPVLNVIALKIAKHIEGRGYRALPVPSSGAYDTERLKAPFSHKLAAHLSGLGWIGKSCLLVHPKYGPRVRLVSVLTDAPLSENTALERSCGKCRVCVEACPAGAFTGKAFSPADPVEERFHARKCRDYRITHTCGVCVASCPAGSLLHLP